MAQKSEEEIIMEPLRGTIEKRSVPARPAAPSHSSSLLALAILILFMLTCAAVFFGDRLGLHVAKPATAPAEQPAAH
jgi:hypothetical protein